MRFSICFLLAPILLVVLLAPSPASAQNWTMRLNVRGRPLEGTPISWSSRRVLLLARDGQLWDFSPKDADNYQKVSTRFSSYTPGELRGVLQGEFGKQFEVTGAGCYLVVHPAGQRDYWAKRFENLYRSFVRYFSVRGSEPKTPTFPLIAVVFHDRDEFVRYSAREGAQAAGVLGYYFSTSNRVYMYDAAPPGTSGDDPNWHLNAETILHEAAHQAAFNSGIHNRFAPQPKWLVEGLGTMFEAPGVWNSTVYPQLKDRVNPRQLQQFKHRLAQQPQGWLAELASSDRLFQTDPVGAYAESWAISFYLAEKHPRKYASFLEKTAARPNFQDYPAPNRLADFTRMFGADLRMLETRVVRFLEGL